MTDRYATFLTCDDVLFALNGKVFINGMYTADLIIPTNDSRLNQIVIFVMADTPIERPFRSFTIRAELPGESEPRIFDAMPFIRGIPSGPAPTRSTMKIRIPFLIQQPVLRSGAIEVSVVHEEGTTFAGRQWVRVADEPSPIISKN